MTDLTPSQTLLLKWLGQEDFSQYGECHGKDLDSLVEKKLAQIHGLGEHQVFIARGTGPMYRAVSLTASGRLLLRTHRKYANGTPMFAPDGTMLDEHGNRSIFDDVDE